MTEESFTCCKDPLRKTHAFSDVEIPRASCVQFSDLRITRSLEGPKVYSLIPQVHDDPLPQKAHKKTCKTRVSSRGVRSFPPVPRNPRGPKRLGPPVRGTVHPPCPPRRCPASAFARFHRLSGPRRSRNIRMSRTKRSKRKVLDKRTTPAAPVPWRTMAPLRHPL